MAPVVASVDFRTKVAQVDAEIDGFIELLKTEGVKSYLEIGSQYGGSFFKVGSSLPGGSRLVSVDRPHPGHDTERHLIAARDELRELGYFAEVFLGDSTAPGVIRLAANFAPYDAIFIDGNHTLPYVTTDWQNFGGMARIVAFHDIVWDRPVRPGRLPIEVRKLWLQIKGQYRHKEIIAPGSEKGIGVLWRQ